MSTAGEDDRWGQIMKMMISAILLSVGFACTAHADRLLYTSETVDGATVIGAWSPGDIKKQDQGSVLQKPSRLIKGDSTPLQKVIYTSRLQAAVNGITGRGLILFIRVSDGEADLVGDMAFVPYDEITEKAVLRIVSQFDIRKRWDTMTVRDQIERSDLIVVGSFMDFGQDVEDAVPTLTVDTTLRGVSTREIELLPDGVTPAQGKFLFFIQRYYGSGPDYMLMRCIPIKRATEYLNAMKKTESQPLAGGDGKPAPQL